MIEILWEFKVAPEHAAEFERHYSADGTWAQFFRQGAGYQGTVLLRDSEQAGRYVTVDTWESLAAFEAFRRRHAAEYAAIDRMCENLTRDERRIGIFEVASE